ncbi:hypothetical protein B0H14DRAFT_2689813 [Mycena olivaceomarginata]|nr:hypothetical protein B0H14DRAFT_2689813 [Mycena olivaceomarginata]
MSQETPQGLVVTTALEGLVFVYLEPGPVSEADLNDWYDNEHAPLKLTVPGVKSAIRYKAVGGRTILVGVGLVQSHSSGQICGIG